MFQQHPPMKWNPSLNSVQKLLMISSTRSCRTTLLQVIATNPLFTTTWYFQNKLLTISIQHGPNVTKNFSMLHYLPSTFNEKIRQHHRPLQQPSHQKQAQHREDGISMARETTDSNILYRKWILRRRVMTILRRVVVLGREIVPINECNVYRWMRQT